MKNKLEGDIRPIIFINPKFDFTEGILKPEPVKDEMKVMLVDSDGHGLEDKNENEVWDELINDLYDYFNDENNGYPQSLLDKIKQKFTITRKPNI